jgi:hypothetical protein
MSDLLLRLYERQRLVYWGEFDGPVELGRQMTGEPGPFAERQIEVGLWRLVFAHADELLDRSRPSARLYVPPLAGGLGDTDGRISTLD